MNGFDGYIINSLHNLSANSTFNNLMLLLVDNDLIKGGFVVSLLWYFWFQSDWNLNIKKKIITILISCIIAIAIGKALAEFLPFRMRPVLNPQLSFLFPFSGEQFPWLESHSSMPSDHAVLFFALATGIFLISKRIGILAFLYISLFVLLPRIYLGYHYPTDVLVGAGVGILMVLILSFQGICNRISTKVVELSFKYPGIFALLFFLLTFQIGTLFNSSRHIMKFLLTDILHLV